jgi:alkylresorcinol/alkylpyrone synthase
MIPGLDRHVAARLGLQPAAQCVSLTGLGCAGAVRAIGLGADLLRGRPDGATLVVAVELSSLWLQVGEPSPEDIHANLTFGDGAAAAVLVPPKEIRAPHVVRHRAVQWPNSIDARGAVLTSSGWRHHASPRLPRLLAAHLRRTVREFLSTEGLDLRDLEFVVVNPSDRRLAAASAELLGMQGIGDSAAMHIWKHYGNTLSVGPLHLLRHIAEASPPQQDALGLLIVLGPGITSDLLLIRWGTELPTSHQQARCES